MVDLDDPEVYQRLDPGQMLTHLHRFPQQCKEAWQKAKDFKLPQHFGSSDKVVVMGMGGSAIGGDLVRSLTSSLNTPIIFIHRDYDLPAFVDEQTLVIASSYSGMTEETLSAFSQSLKTKARKLVITTDGKLRTLAEEHNVPVFLIDYSSPPRAALGYGLLPLLNFLYQLGYLKEIPQVEETIQALEVLVEKLQETVPTHLNPAKEIAIKLYDKLIVIYGAGLLAEVARRWKTQFNENSKAWAFHEVFSELNHNAVVGYSFPKKLAQQVCVILLRSPSLHPRILARYQVTSEILGKAGIEHQIVDSEDKSGLSQVMSMIFIGDWVSYYLAMLYETDPSEVRMIDYLKGRLNSI